MPQHLKTSFFHHHIYEPHNIDSTKSGRLTALSWHYFMLERLIFFVLSSAVQYSVIVWHSVVVMGNEDICDNVIKAWSLQLSQRLELYATDLCNLLLMLRIYWIHDNWSLEKNSTRSRVFLFAKIINTLLIIIVHVLSLKNSVIITLWSCQNRLLIVLRYFHHRLYRHSSWLNFLKILFFFRNKY